MQIKFQCWCHGGSQLVNDWMTTAGHKPLLAKSSRTTASFIKYLQRWNINTEELFSCVNTWDCSSYLYLSFFFFQETLFWHNLVFLFCSDATLLTWLKHYFIKYIFILSLLLMPQSFTIFFLIEECKDWHETFILQLFKVKPSCDLSGLFTFSKISNSLKCLGLLKDYRKLPSYTV